MYPLTFPENPIISGTNSKVVSNNASIQNFMYRLFFRENILISLCKLLLVIDFYAE